MDRTTMTGVIQTGDKPILFSAITDKFEFSFLTDSVYEFGNNTCSAVLSSKDGFIYGKTHDNFPIAIYTGSPSFEIYGSRHLITSAYVKSSSSLTDTSIAEFQAIQFCGGTLNKLFHANGINFDLRDGKIIVSANDDSKEYTISTDDNDMKLVVRSMIREERGIHRNAIVNENVELTLEFSSPQPLSSLFTHYGRMIDLMSFMTFRENVGFDNICLMNPDPHYHFLTKYADVKIRNEKRKTEKDGIFSITFEDLDDVIPALVKLFYDSKDKSQSIALGYYRTDDDDHSMTNEKIRAICSALERELNYISDLKQEENRELDELKEVVRETVKKYHKDHVQLSNDTYNTILSSIGYWSFPLAEKICALYKKYLREMLLLNRSEIGIDEGAIKSFVKYRNDITHGRHRTLDIVVAYTAFYLGGLVYCCILDRAGLDRQKIYNLCSLKILS